MCNEYANTWSYEYGIVCNACKEGYHYYPHLRCQCNVEGCTCLQYPKRVDRYYPGDYRCVGCRQGTHYLCTVSGSLQGSASRGRPCDYSDELPPNHFWDSEEAEQEYYELGQALAQAQEKQQEKLSVPQSRLHTHMAVYNCFSGVPGVAYEDKALSDALNPYWLRDGRAFCEFAQGEGSLIVQKVESETVRETVDYLRNGRYGATDCRLEYSYEKRVDWYTPTGDAAVSLLEWALLGTRKVFMPPLPPDEFDCYSSLLDRIRQELHALIAPLTQQIVLTFSPDLAPTNIEHIRVSVFDPSKYNKVPRLNYPYLTRYSAPKAGERFGPASYQGIHWLMCGRWKPHQFSQDQLETVRERIQQIEQRVRKWVVDSNDEIAQIEEEVNLLYKKRKALRIRYYKPLAYRKFWQAIQAAGQQDRS